MSARASTSADVIIVGAGVTGVATAVLLARQGVRVILVDRWRTYPACFKAEKIEPDQIELLRKFGLMEALVPMAAHIHSILVAQGERILRTERREQFGIFYQDIVNGVRTCLPPSLDFRIARVQDIKTDLDVQRVTLEGGEECTARLVALACGAGGDFPARLGMQRRVLQEAQSLACGFTLARSDGQPFNFDALTYYPEGCAERVAFLSLFLVGTVMRVNLFLYWALSEDRTRSFVHEPARGLARILPGLTRVIGPFDVVTKVETARIDLYRTEGVLRPGVVLLADAFQGVCPTTGLGLSKVLTDVDVLCHDCVPRWLTTPGMGVDKIAEFYANPRKTRVDQRVLELAASGRRFGVNDTLWWRARRARRRLTQQLAGWRDHLSSAAC